MEIPKQRWDIIAGSGIAIVVVFVSIAVLGIGGVQQTLTNTTNATSATVMTTLPPQNYLWSGYNDMILSAEATRITVQSQPIRLMAQLIDSIVVTLTQHQPVNYAVSVSEHMGMGEGNS